MYKNFQRLHLRPVATLLASLFASHLAWAIEPFTVRDIRVEGLQRVEPGTVFASLPFHVGDTYSDDKGAAAIRALFALGLFKDVRLDVSGDALVVIVEERPTIADVNFIGVKEFDKDVLIKALRDVGLAEGRPFDKALADKAEQELKRQYISHSLYGAQITTTTTPIDRNRVSLTFSVVEGQLAKIKDIRVVGNRDFSEGTLLGLFDQDSGGVLSWYTKSDRYSRTKLNADLETLRSYYLTRGYLEFKVESTQVAISPDKDSISITINISEGQRFVVSSVQLQGNYLGKDDEFKSLIKIKVGQAYNADLVTQTSKAFSDYFAAFGYAFAQVTVKPEIDRITNQVSFVLQADPQHRAYVRRINIAGNNRTRDEIIRREFRQFEDAWYDGDKIKASRDRVDRLGYFKNVNIDTQEVPNAPDQVDLNLTVEEKPTGNLSIGAGFSSAERFSVSFGIKQDNIFGTGTNLGLNVNTSKFNRNVTLSFLDPYFTKDGISRGIDLYYRASRPYTDQGGNYQLITAGVSTNFGIPISEFNTVYLGGGVERTEIKPGTQIPAAYLLYADRFGYLSNAVPLTLGWQHDSRDSALAPNKGIYQRFNAVWSPGGDERYVRADYQFQDYIELNKKFTVAFNTEMGYGKGLQNHPFPVFKDFYAGGLGSVRGYAQGTLGPRDVTGADLGGVKKFNVNWELQTPFPGAGNDRTLRLYAFYDAGNVFGADQSFAFNQLRSSVGVGLSWISPVGPLRLAWANPMRMQPGDRIQRLQFQMGTSF